MGIDFFIFQRAKATAEKICNASQPVPREVGKTIEQQMWDCVNPAYGKSIDESELVYTVIMLPLSYEDEPTKHQSSPSNIRQKYQERRKYLQEN